MTIMKGGKISTVPSLHSSGIGTVNEFYYLGFLTEILYIRELLILQSSPL